MDALIIASACISFTGATVSGIIANYLTRLIDRMFRGHTGTGTGHGHGEAESGD